MTKNKFKSRRRPILVEFERNTYCHIAATGIFLKIRGTIFERPCIPAVLKGVRF